MKIKQLLLMSILSLSLLGFSENNKKGNDLIFLKLKGNVKSLKEFAYKAIDESGKITKGEKLRNLESMDDEYDYYKVFDENGNIIEVISYDSAGRRVERTTYIYDKNGNEIEVIDYYYDYSVELLSRKRTFKYDEDENIIEEIWYDPSIAGQYIYKYNEEGNMIEKVWYNPDGGIIEKKAYKYDENSNMIKEIEYDSDGKSDITVTNKYDQNGNVIEKIEYDSDGKLYNTVTYKNDKNGNMIEGNWLDAEGNIQEKVSYKYNIKGQVVELSWYGPEDGSTEKYSYEYNENGHVIEYSRYDSDGSLNNKNTYKYEYDKFGNWLKKIIFENEIPKYILEREIEYFN